MNEKTNDPNQSLVLTGKQLKLIGLTRKQYLEQVEPIRDSKVNPKINRNDPCPCGSGLKYKKCCMNI